MIFENVIKDLLENNEFNSSTNEKEIFLLDLEDEPTIEYLKSVFTSIIKEKNINNINSFKDFSKEDYEKILSGIFNEYINSLKEEENIEDENLLISQYEDELNEIGKMTINVLNSLRYLFENIESEEYSEEEKDELIKYLSKIEDIFKEILIKLEEIKELEKEEISLEKEESEKENKKEEEEELSEESEEEFEKEKEIEEENSIIEKGEKSDLKNENDIIENINEDIKNSQKKDENEYFKTHKIITNDNKEIEIEFIYDENLSEKPQGKVDKDFIKEFLIKLNENIKDKKELQNIAEKIFLVVDCLDKKSCYKYPVAEIKEGEKENKYYAILNINGLRSAVIFLMMSKKSYSHETFNEIKNKLINLYKLINKEPPQSLSNSKEEKIEIIYDEEIINSISKEINKSFEEIIDDIEIIKSILNSLYNSNILKIENEEFNSILNDNDNIIIKIDSSEEFNKIINKFNKFINSIFSEEKDAEDDISIYEYINTLRNEIEDLKNKIITLEEEKSILEEEKEEIINNLNSHIQKEKEYEFLIKKMNVLDKIINESNDISLIKLNYNSLTEIENEEELEQFIKHKLSEEKNSNIKFSKMKMKLLNSFNKYESSYNLNKEDIQDKNIKNEKSLLDVLAKYI